MKISVHVDMKPTDQIIKRIFDDRTGIFLAETWAKIFTKYTPKDSGTLSQS